ncbi:MAG: twin arginine-targeting protein translocase TatC [Bacillus thermozeamaize]|jgi:sec-independent protein translocase protein TatC|uniref:Sec-independent protein translocase protein TatC n=1 Tax=Bacillus thermozeamaize TaxID=230954 RepID=A0A1Y3PHZ5_9BACI|nr:MAG: twin arginine-targeting protein translocase TatC [Bacillus thermozeamaize]
MRRLTRRRHIQEEQDAKEMHWLAHYAELRKRLIRVMIVFVLSFIAGFAFSEPIVQWLKAGAQVQVDWHVFSPGDALWVWLQVAFISSLVVVVPYLLFELWGFVAPGLTPRERRVTLRYIPASAVLFAGGICFAYTVLFPMLLRFMQSLAERIGANEMYGVAQYFQFMFNFILPFGLLFELPVVMLFLTRLGILNPRILSRARKYAYLALVIIATMITPPDLVSDLMVTIPLFLLYEISLWLSVLTYRKMQRARSLHEANES